jgi:alpha-tubulin suppressor-like RCC1 family protein
MNTGRMIKLALKTIVFTLALNLVAFNAFAQTSLNKSNKYFCLDRTVLLSRKGVQKLQDPVKLTKQQKASQKDLSSKLKRARGATRKRIATNIRDIKELLANIPRCLRGDFDPAISVEPTMGLGSRHSCAISRSGDLKCWGNNFNGELGNGVDTTNRNTPSSVSGSAKYIAVAGGETFTCAVTSAGAAQCWGRNVFGQLGDGSNIDRRAPVQVVGLSSGVTAVVAGHLHGCALLSSGTVKCWGENSDGQLGNGSGVASNTPVDVVGLSGVQSIESGAYYTCAVLQGGAVKCWGYNALGQLGDNSRQSRGIPVDVVGLSSGVASVSAGWGHTCAVLNSGSLMCWGAYGAHMGDNSTSDRLIPAPVTTVAGVTEVAVGNQFTCAIVSGGVQCWGLGNDGRLGNGQSFTSLTPVSASGISSAGTLRTGDSHACVIVGGSQGYCWGSNANGQIGSGSSSQTSESPAPISGFPLS